MGLTEDRIRDFEERKARLMTMGGEKMIQRQHELGKLTARERLDLLFDKGTFQEVQLFVKHRSTLFGLAEKEINADGVVTGYGNVNGRTVFAAAQDFTSAGGSLGEMHAKRYGSDGYGYRRPQTLYRLERLGRRQDTGRRARP